jgi:hypothetical protein
MMTGVGESAVQNAAMARTPRTAKRPPIDLAASSIEIVPLTRIDGKA